MKQVVIRVLSSVVWEFNQDVKFACTGFEALHYDLENNKIQKLLDFSKPAQHIFVFVFPEKEKTYCLISWLKRNDILFSKFQEHLHNLPEEKRKNYINNLLPMK